MLFHPNTSGYIDVTKVMNWHSICHASLEKMESSYNYWMINGAIGKPPINLPSDINSNTEVRGYFANCAKELELAGILWLVTSLEGRLRIDLRSRYNEKDLLATSLKKIADSKSEEFLVPFEAGILESWKFFLRNSSVNNALADLCINHYGQIKPLIKLRHWLAHGRYWDAKINPNTFDIFAARNAIDNMFASFSQAASQVNIKAIP